MASFILQTFIPMTIESVFLFFCFQYWFNTEQVLLYNLSMALLHQHLHTTVNKISGMPNYISGKKKQTVS